MRTILLISFLLFFSALSAGAAQPQGIDSQALKKAEFYSDKWDVNTNLVLAVLLEEAIERPDQQSSKYLLVSNSTRQEIQKYWRDFKPFSSNKKEQSLEYGVLALRMNLEAYDGDWVMTLVAYRNGLSKSKEMAKLLSDNPKLRDKVIFGEDLDALSKQTDIPVKNLDYVSRVLAHCFARIPNFTVPDRSILFHLPKEDRLKYMEKLSKKQQ